MCMCLYVCGVSTSILSPQEKMIAVVVGLLRQKKVNFMFAAREELSTFIRNFMKEVYTHIQGCVAMSKLLLLTDALQLFTRETSHLQWNFTKVSLIVSLHQCTCRIL